MEPLDSWSDLQNDNWDTLILGNGASIAIHDKFNYRSLFQSAHLNQYLTEQIDRIFKYFDSSDFEFVLRMLWHTHNINEALGIKTNAASQAYSEVRAALIQSVRSNHINAADLRSPLDISSNFMSRFKTVISLNYDLIVYWAMMQHNRKLGHTHFKDAFIDEGQRFRKDWEFLRKSHGGADGATMVFYPHGALMLGRTITSDERKIVGDDIEPLLDAITGKWDSGEFIPLFVSEGESIQKRQAIQRSDYLSHVFDNVLPSLGNSVVIYGWSMSKQDDHIVNQIFGTTSKIRQVACSIRTEGESPKQILKTINTLKEKFDAVVPKLEVRYFRAEDSGVWSHPSETVESS